jgi:cytoskeletal protein CcmA (bactofilin family)
VNSSSIGPSVIIKGELSGTEDLTIDGRVEGTVNLRSHVLTVGPQGKVEATVAARAVVVLGKVVGDITATEKVSIRDAGTVEGDLVTPSVAIADGAHFQGSIDMSGKAGAQAAGPKAVPPVSKPNGQAGKPVVA